MRGPLRMDRTFVVVLRATSAARFLEHECLEFRDLQTHTSQTGPLTVSFRTIYAQEGYDSPVPRQLWIEVRGRGPSLNEAISVFAGVAASLVPVLALVA